MTHNLKIYWVALALLSASAHAAKDPDLLAGDIAQVLLPATGLAMTFHFDDADGRVQWMKNMSATIVATEAAKYSFDKTYLGERPNGGSQSFPSGHTTASCSGAFFMANRYGWEYGAPALLLAAFTGYSRVDEGFHRWRDVIAGCAMSYGISSYLVDSYKSQLTLTPKVGSRLFEIEADFKF